MAALIDWHLIYKIRIESPNRIFKKRSDNRRDDKHNPSKTATNAVNFLIPSGENTSDKLFKHILLWCRIPPPLLRELFPFLQLACRWPWGGIDPPRAWEPHILHTSVSTGLLLASVKPTVYSLPAGLGASSGGGALWSITKTMVPYGEQKDLPLAFSARNKRCSILCAAAVTLGLQFLA